MSKKERATAPTAAPQIKTLNVGYTYLEQMSSRNSDLTNNSNKLSLNETILGFAVLLDDHSLNQAEKSLCGFILRNGIYQLIKRSRGAGR